jgi:hypothetical protein
MTAAAIKACFADWRPVKSRSVLQLVLEVPVEQTEHILKTLGAPIPGTETWVGVALLSPEVSKVEPASIKPGESPSRAAGAPGAPPQHGTGAASGDAKPRREMSLPQRVGMLCNDSSFQEWAVDFAARRGMSFGNPPAGPLRRDAVASIVRTVCGVQSRSEIQPGTEAAKRWSAILDDFERATGRRTEER